MDLEQKIATYRPAAEALQLVRQTRIALLVGISGAGKDTIKHRLLEKSDYQAIISHTTRAPRNNNNVPEVDGHEYHFIDEAAARAMLDQQAFVEAKFVHGTLYGTSVQELANVHRAGKIAVTDLDVQGVAEYKVMSDAVVAVFILPPGYDVWRERLKRRYQTEADFEIEWPARRDSALRELTNALDAEYYHFVVNDDLERAVRVTDEIIASPDITHAKNEEARSLARMLRDAILRG